MRCTPAEPLTGPVQSCQCTLSWRQWQHVVWLKSTSDQHFALNLQRCCSWSCCNYVILFLPFNTDQEGMVQDASATSVETAAAAVAKFEPKAAAALLEEEIREAVVGTVGTAVGMASASPPLPPRRGVKSTRPMFPHAHASQNACRHHCHPSWGLMVQYCIHMSHAR